MGDDGGAFSILSLAIQADFTGNAVIMKIQILSDLHIELEMFNSSYLYQTIRHNISETPADVVVLAGDIYTKGRGPGVAAERFKKKQVVMVAGNHEYYVETYPTHTDQIQQNAAEFKNVHFLENQAVEIDDVVFLGCSLWTDLKLWETGPHAGLYNRTATIWEVSIYMHDYTCIRFCDGRRQRELLPGDLVTVHLDSVRWLREQFEIHRSKKVVVVTHQAPSFKSVPEVFSKDILSAAFASHLDDLVEQSGAILWVHGHSHTPCDYTIGKTRVIANPLGYPDENPYFKPDLVIDV